MSYTSTQRNKAILLIGDGHADFTKSAFYEDLESFNWITIKKTNGVINAVELTYTGKDMYNRLLKQQRV